MTIWESPEAEDWAIEQAIVNPEGIDKVLSYLVLSAPNLNQQLQALKLRTTVRGYLATI